MLAFWVRYGQLLTLCCAQESVEDGGQVWAGDEGVGAFLYSIAPRHPAEADNKDAHLACGEIAGAVADKRHRMLRSRQCAAHDGLAVLARQRRPAVEVAVGALVCEDQVDGVNP